MRGCLWLEPHGLLVPFAESVFEAYWSHDLDVSQDEVLARLVERLGVSAQAFSAGIGSPSVKDALRVNTDELVARGGFGSPTFFVDGEMFFGNDRLPLVSDALARRASREVP
jgi:2-hydroxychromene-2-carboxylate isomerase